MPEMRNPTVTDFTKGKAQLRLILDTSEEWLKAVTEDPAVDHNQAINFLLNRLNLQLTNDLNQPDRKST